MHTALHSDSVIIDPPAAVIAERQRLGLDGRDEVWDGEYHMVPNPSNGHMRTELRLAMALDPIARQRGLEILCEVNLLASAATGFGDFRVPDLVVFGPEHDGDIGVVGSASLVVELRSPGDESFKKLGFYERLQVGEVLIIERDTKRIRRWALTDGRLAESPGVPTGHHRLACLPVTVHADHGLLVVTTELGTTRI